MLASYPVLAIIALVYRWQSRKSFDANRWLEAVNMTAILLSIIVFINYLLEFFIAWYSGYIYEQFAFYDRALGPYYYLIAIAYVLAALSPQIFWIKKLRQLPFYTILVMSLSQLGFWMGQFVIIITSLNRDFIPSSWSYAEQPMRPIDWGITTIFFVALLFGIVYFARKIRSGKIDISPSIVLLFIILCILLIFVWNYWPLLLFLFWGNSSMAPGLSVGLIPSAWGTILFNFILPAFFCVASYLLLRRFGKES